MNKTLKIFIEVAVIVALIAAGVYFYQQAQIKKQQEAESAGQSTVDSGPMATSTALLLIDFGPDRLEHFESQVTGPATAWELLQKGALSLELKLDSQDYGEMGILVKQIGDKKNGDDGQNWIYYVNGQPAQVAASQNQIKAGDKVEWRFEKASF